MPHDSSKVKMGTTASSDRTVDCYVADPDDFPAGTAVRLADDGGLQVEDDAVACHVGISLGADLANSQRTSVCRAGLGVPLIQKKYAASGLLTVTNYTNAVGDTVSIGGVDFVGQAGAATPGDATFQAATSLAATATSLKTQINAHAALDGVVTAEDDDDEVTVTAVETGLEGNDIEFVWTAASSAGGTASGTGTLAGGSDGVAVVGGTVYVNDDGHGCDSEDDDAVATGGVYAGTPLTAVAEDGTETQKAALVDMPGGL